MASIPYLLNYNGNYPTTTTYSGSGVDIVNLNGNYVSASKEATYIRLYNSGSSTQVIKFQVVNNDNHIGSLLQNDYDNAPTTSYSVAQGATFDDYWTLSPGRSAYIIVPFKHTIALARCVPDGNSTDYVRNNDVQIRAFIGGKCLSLGSQACRGLYITDLTFSNNFTGSIGPSCFEDCKVSQSEINVGRASSIDDYAFWGLDAVNHSVTFTTSSNLSYIGQGSFGLDVGVNSTNTYTISLNLPSTKSNIHTNSNAMVKFINCAPKTDITLYPTITGMASKLQVYYSYSSSLNSSSAESCYGSTYNKYDYEYSSKFNAYIGSKSGSVTTTPTYNL